eukprot:gene11139-biopygen294
MSSLPYQPQPNQHKLTPQHRNAQLPHNGWEGGLPSDNSTIRQLSFPVVLQVVQTDGQLGRKLPLGCRHVHRCPCYLSVGMQRTFVEHALVIRKSSTARATGRGYEKVWQSIGTVGARRGVTVARYGPTHTPRPHGYREAVGYCHAAKKRTVAQESMLRVNKLTGSP